MIDRSGYTPMGVIVCGVIGLVSIYVIHLFVQLWSAS